MQLILDEHVSTAIARALLERGVNVVTVSHWHDGDLRSTADSHILVKAAVEQRVLVTFDINTIPPLIESWLSRGIHHAGVIFVSRKTFRQDDVGGIVRALLRLVAERGSDDWRDQTTFLRP